MSDDFSHLEARREPGEYDRDRLPSFMEAA